MKGWVTRQGSRVLAERCDDTWAVHLEASGMTHLVDNVSGEVLLFLAQGVQSSPDIRGLVVALLDDPSITMDWIKEQWLDPLAAVGLIEEVV